MEWKFGRNQTNGKQIRSRLSTIIAMKRMPFSNFLQFCEVSFCHYFSEWTKKEAIPSLINLYSLKWKHQNHWLSHWSYSSTRNSPFSNTPIQFWFHFEVHFLLWSEEVTFASLFVCLNNKNNKKLRDVRTLNLKCSSRWLMEEKICNYDEDSFKLTKPSQFIIGLFLVSFGRHHLHSLFILT